MHSTIRCSVLVLLLLVGTASRLGAQCERLVVDLLDPFGGANDLNGNGRFDLSDMVMGLRYLFSGGAPPCPVVLDPSLQGGSSLQRVFDRFPEEYHPVRVEDEDEGTERIVFPDPEIAIILAEQLAEEARTQASDGEQWVDLTEEISVASGLSVSVRVLAGLHGGAPGEDGASVEIASEAEHEILIAAAGDGADGDDGGDGGAGGSAYVRTDGQGSVVVAVAGDAGHGGPRRVARRAGNGGVAGEARAVVGAGSDGQGIVLGGSGGDGGDSFSPGGRPGQPSPGGSAEAAGEACPKGGATARGKKGGDGGGGADGVAGGEGTDGTDGADGSPARAVCDEGPARACKATATGGNGGAGGKGGKTGSSTPGGWGGNGGKGGLAEAISCCPGNATATSGAAGKGGHGGEGCDGGRGGTGGATGNATAETRAGDGTNSKAEAKTKDGGQGGSGGKAAPGCLMGFKGPGGTAGVADAINGYGGDEKDGPDNQGKDGPPGAEGRTP